MGRVCRPLWPLVGLGCLEGVQFCLPHETDRALSRPGTYCTLSEHDIAWSRKSGLLRNHAKAVAGGLGVENGPDPENLGQARPCLAAMPRSYRRDVPARALCSARTGPARTGPAAILRCRASCGRRTPRPRQRPSRRRRRPSHKGRGGRCCRRCQGAQGRAYRGRPGCPGRP